MQRSNSIRHDALLEAEAKKAFLEEQRRNLLQAAPSLRQSDSWLAPDPNRPPRSGFMLTSLDLEESEEKGQQCSSSQMSTGSSQAHPFRRSPGRRRSSILDLPHGVASGGDVPGGGGGALAQHTSSYPLYPAPAPPALPRSQSVGWRAGHRTVSASLDGGSFESHLRQKPFRQQQQQNHPPGLLSTPEILPDPIRRSASVSRLMVRMLPDPREAATGSHQASGPWAASLASQRAAALDPPRYDGAEGETTFELPSLLQRRSSFAAIVSDLASGSRTSNNNARRTLMGSMTSLGDDPHESVRSIVSRLSRHHSLEAPVPAGPVVAAAPSQELRKLKMMQRLAAGGAASSRANAVLKELMSASPTEQGNVHIAEMRKAKLDHLLKFGAELREGGMMHRYTSFPSLLDLGDN